MEGTIHLDDLRPGGAGSFLFEGPEEVIEAHRLDEVLPALRQVELAARAGRWAAGFVAYDAAPAFDAHLRVPGPQSAMPLLWFGLYPARRSVSPPDGRGAYRTGAWEPSIEQASYREAIDLIRKHICRGDTYQVNYTYRLQAPVEGDLAVWYTDLCRAQRAGYCADLDLGRFRVLSVSPELFFEWRDGVLRTRPMKGTAPRGRWSEDDEMQRERLLTSEKNRAENLMIVDLLRNDLGRIARFGSVEVEELLAAERYETVWQLTSTIRAKPRDDIGLDEVFSALFPCGSVTGAPKVRTMEIIAELERGARGLYTGAIGMVGPGLGDIEAVFSVAIRTVVVDVTAGRAEYGVGGGITLDSSPEGEYAETLDKAKVLSHRIPEVGLFETMRWEPEGVRHLERHLARMEHSAAYFGMPFERKAAEAAVDEAMPEEGGPRRLRLLLDADGRITVEVTEMPAESAEPVKLIVDAESVNSQDWLLFHKTTRRDLYEERRARHPEAGDVVLVNERGEVTETTIANLAVKLDGRWVTPPLDSGCLPGIERQVLLDKGRLEERVVTVAELKSADEIAVINSLRGWLPVIVTIG